jgi:hypothetical protein
MQGLPLAQLHYSDANYDDNEENWDWDNDNKPCLIVPGLFIGSAEAEGNNEALSSHQISHVLTVAEGLDATHPAKRKYLQIHIDDSPDEDIVIHLAKVGLSSLVRFAPKGHHGNTIYCISTGPHLH